MRILISSANMGGTEKNLFVPQDGPHAVDFVCFNDTNFPSREASFTPRMTAKIPKMLSWELRPGYDLYVWIDFYFNIGRSDVAAWFVNNIGDAEAIFFRHPHRKTILQEVEFIQCASKNGNDPISGKVRGENLTGQVRRYLADPDFTDDRLFSCGCFAYTKKMVANKYDNPMREWFFQTAVGSIRDQVSLPWVLSQYDCDYVTNDLDISNWDLIK